MHDFRRIRRRLVPPGFTRRRSSLLREIDVRQRPACLGTAIESGEGHVQGRRILNAWDKFIHPTRPLLASLAAFVRAGFRPQTLLARAIVTVLVIKLVAVTAMMIAQHHMDRSAVADSAGVADRLGPASAP